MCRQNSSVQLSAEEAIAAEESLLIYCKPVELYNILQRRALQNPTFLQRCLRYKIQARRTRRLSAGNVIFNYRGYNKTVRKTEVTEEFSCPFCLSQCASFKGLRYHLCSSHDLFNFEFWVTEEYQAVNVSVKIDRLDSQIIADDVHPRQQTFFFCSKPRMRIKPKDPAENAKYVYPHFLESASPILTEEGICEGISERNDDVLSCKGGGALRSFPSEKDLQNGSHKGVNCGPVNLSATECIEHVASRFNTGGVSIAMAHCYPDPEVGTDLTQLAMVQSTKTKKLSSEQSASRNRLLLQKRQFFHSHRAQPMALDQVLSDRDSEDEVDDEIADFEDRRMLDDFVDVTKDEKHFMHLWNSFVRKQRVLADGHVPWACKAFTKLHVRELVEAPALFWL
ncbi:polycomb group protein EMBRYONIC FLOWER 2-like isoform X2 [Malania oleifera]|uniref:polycomb group protein EMBRYONIC FLOWER 2-like isoform X2 n=1 Tax=Malania oleifera TaxID=397392 RepID=UPI0025AE87A6|nr:polycomb group protein EMBRYONIC FLOWER 2-like isoform X2 [Malania oleifera]